MSLELQLAALDRDAKALKAQIELGNALDKLRSNRDFNKLVTEGYLKDEAIRLVHLKSDPNMQSPEKQAAIMRDIDAIGALASFLLTIDQRANIARKQMPQLEETRTELLAEGA